MTQPAGYTPTTDFSQEEGAAASGRSTVNTAKLDAEFANIETTLDAVLVNLAILQRDDTRLKDQIVTPESLAPSTLALIGSATGSRWTPRGQWISSRAYAYLDMVEEANASYLCLVAHTSGVFVTDHSAGKWMLIGPLLFDLADVITVSGSDLVLFPTSGLVHMGNPGSGEGQLLITSAGANNVFLTMNNDTLGGIWRFVANNSGVAQYIASSASTAARHDFLSYDGTSTLFRMLPSGAADVNFLQATGAATGLIPVIGAAGSDAGIHLSIVSKGTGSIFFGNGTVTEVEIVHSSNLAVNRLQLTGSTTTNPVNISAAGTDTNIGMTLQTKGSGAFLFVGNGATQLSISAIASASRYITIAGSNGGNPTIGVSGGSLALSSAVVCAGASIAIAAGTAVPAGGTAATGLLFSTTANLGIFFGSGAPTLSAAQGSLYIRTDGSSTTTRAYVNTNGSTTWTSITTAA